MGRRPGTIVLFGSGESLPEAQPIHDSIMRAVGGPIRACVVETPAGFEPNSAQVAGRLGDYLKQRLQNYRPDVTIVPARRRGTAFSPDNAEIARPLLRANYIVMGPGSPTYTVRQLANSAAWQTIVARSRLGNPLLLASAATIAVGDYALPVYEIYKVGEELHWKGGLSLFGPYAISIAFVPHWDNRDGGEDLDTSRCFMGKARFAELRRLLPRETVVVGIDERTALILDFATREARVMGSGGVTWIRGADEKRIDKRQSCRLDDLGFGTLSDDAIGIPAEVWAQAVDADRATEPSRQVPDEIATLVAARAEARSNRDWSRSDQLRDAIAKLGWKVNDTPDGAAVEPLVKN